MGTILHWAQETLAQKLGTLPKDSNFDDVALEDYKRLFIDPLSQEAIATLTSLFKLDCNLTVQVDDTLIRHGGHGMLDACGQDEAIIRKGDAPPLAQASQSFPQPVMAA